jgi:SNF2 family DNA or RNA helicase
VNVPQFRLEPRPYQLAEVEANWNAEGRILMWEPGTGKSKATIDTLAYLFANDEVDGLLVFAPNLVHRNWTAEELPKHLPESVLKDARFFTHYSKSSKTADREFEWVLKSPGLAVLTMAYEATITDRGKDRLGRFLRSRRALGVADESQRIKTPGAKSSRVVLGCRKHFRYRRALSGTPVDNSPFDVYNQLRFLDPDVWVKYGIKNFSAFKAYFGVFVSMTANGRTFNKCVGFRNLDVLKDVVARYGSRIVKADVLADLPPKVYSKAVFDLPPKHRKAYDALRDEARIELEDGGEATAILAMTRVLRLQQVTCGYIGNDDGKISLIDAKLNPRLDLLAQIAEDLSTPTIVWARFTKDIDLIVNHPVFKGRCARIDGSTPHEARGPIVDRFQSGDVRFLIANPAAISTGVTLHRAETVIYYSNSFKMGERIQSEDRAHRIGLVHPVHYIDIVARGTVDEKILEALRTKVEIASILTGDQRKEWI